MREELTTATTLELAEILGISPRSIAQYYWSGRIAPVIAGPDGQLLWDVAATRHALSRRLHEPQPRAERPVIDTHWVETLLDADLQRPRPRRSRPPRGVYRGHRRPTPEE